MLIIALAALGCGSTESTDQAPDGIPRLQPAGDHRPDPDRSGPFDPDDPAIGNLDPDLLAAVQAAARAARDDGVEMVVTSGWRSRAHQERLYAEAVSKYGSDEKARRYVSTPDASAHVTGDAVDIGPTDADSWLSQHGADYGLCQTFANEMWHYELATTPGGQCPEMLPDGSSRQ